MEVKNIYAAFVKAQSGFAPALKTSLNPHFKSKYADLAACVEAVIDALNANGIALVQRTKPDERGVTVETLFIHESGEHFTGGELHVPASKQDAQGYGSALSYARRYSLMAACGIAPEDDDGNAASKGQKPKAGERKPNGTLQGPDVPPEPDPFAAIPEARRGEINEMADYMVELFRDGQELKPIELAYSLKDTDEQLYLWKLLKPESKLRALIKANSPHNQPKEQA